jgi:hypothetical protein
MWLLLLGAGDPGRGPRDSGTNGDAREHVGRVVHAHRDPPHGEDRREAFAEWLTSTNNPYFAKSTVNRFWSYFFGRGIIDPVDDIRGSNPPSNAALLDRLTDDFVKSGFDLRHVMKTIVLSRVYQSSIGTNRWNEDDMINFSHQVARRLSAEGQWSV